MRNTFIKTLTEIGKKDTNVMLLTGDLGFNALEPFRDALPRQYVNVGVAEQNMVGVAAGLALSGKRVFCYSIIPFATFRCCEHIRDDLAYHNLPVTMVGVGSGYAYGILGSTHHSLEDVAVLRSFPNMTVLCPGDPLEVEALTHGIMKQHGPCYLRLGKAGEPNIHKKPLENCAIGKAITLHTGKDVTIVATGSMLQTAAEARELLETEHISAGLVSMHTLKPFDEEIVQRVVQETALIATVEEHSAIGGLSSAVAQVLSQMSGHAPHLTIATPDSFATDTGSQKFFREKVGLTAEKIAASIRHYLPAHA
ncbi:transketolase [Candidatus Peregrinibacteria bacterium CG10_big_fil_rev_8_21_14_0_10_49_10]|nr:MAG: transketolase [Candidatus Peregrinibacteria bacterium CG10_big_fil_rev_8_21_14_0_10_49_10]